MVGGVFHPLDSRWFPLSSQKALQQQITLLLSSTAHVLANPGTKEAPVVNEAEVQWLVASCSVLLRRCRTLLGQQKKGPQSLMSTSARSDVLLQTKPPVDQFGVTVLERLRKIIESLNLQVGAETLAMEVEQLKSEQGVAKAVVINRLSASDKQWDADGLQSLLATNAPPQSNPTLALLALGESASPGGEGGHEELSMVHEVSLKDPLSMTRQCIPCRTAHCHHLQTFDLIWFLRHCRQEVQNRERERQKSSAAAAAAAGSGPMVSSLSARSIVDDFDIDLGLGLDSSDSTQGTGLAGNSTTKCTQVFRCPICRTQSPLTDVYVDPWLIQVLDTVEPAASAIRINNDGSYEVSAVDEPSSDDEGGQDEGETGASPGGNANANSPGLSSRKRPRPQ